MSNTLNQAALKQYVSQFTSKVLTDFYSRKSVISGPELLKLTPLKQVNLGIVSRLFDQWKADAGAFRSPYFDFENEEVKKALDDFMNTVSQHIAVNREGLEPLLTESVQEALLLLLDPEAYFDGKLRAMPDFVFTQEQAQRMVKYTHIHSGIAKSLALRLTDNGSNFVYSNIALRWLTDILSNGSALDAKEPYIQQFSEVVELDTKSIIKTTAPAEVPAAAPRVPEEKRERSFFDSILTTDTSSTPAPRAATPVASANAGTVASPQILRDRSESIPAPSGPMRTTTAADDSLNNRFKVEVPKASDENTYGNVPIKVESIAKSIPLGQRFMFVSQLFKGSTDAFEDAIRELDQASSFDEAHDMIVYKFASIYRWNTDSEAINDLLTIVKRKFS
ncbi:hypothetical protein [Telluribacter sp. SYSU D00476]|uniref:hypothetical protein n=1 Tax=Telluribacter sp. SYSU D00476 TaxID=2811430 RepID=UPI001FF50143|nr:hypothetical protein [Telluribacter sp. SYSU D00476]